LKTFVSEKLLFPGGPHKFHVAIYAQDLRIGQVTVRYSIGLKFLVHIRILVQNIRFSSTRLKKKDFEVRIFGRTI
jgi:hypothetical protein